LGSAFVAYKRSSGDGQPLELDADGEEVLVMVVVYYSYVVDYLRIEAVVIRHQQAELMPHEIAKEHAK
jgi:hypothetical protein